MYLATDSKGKEYRFTYIPYRVRSSDNKTGVWRPSKSKDVWYTLNPGTIEKWIGRKLTWDDSPVKVSQKEIDSKSMPELPDGLLDMLREQTKDLKVLFIEKTKTYSQKVFENTGEILARSVFGWCKYFLIEPRGEGQFPVGFYNTENAKRYYRILNEARSISSMGLENFTAKNVKEAELHYESSLLKLADRLQKKGLTDNNFKILEKSLDVNFELVLEHECDGKKIKTRCWTIIAEGVIQKPHYRYLVK